MPLFANRALAVAPFIALALWGPSVSIANIVPVSRTSTVSASSSGGGGSTDGTTSFNTFVRGVGAGGGSASQTSYLTTNGAFAAVSATGYDNGSVMQHFGASGTSTFTYVFNLTEPTTLYFDGYIGRFGDQFTSWGSVFLYNDVTNATLYSVVGTPGTEMQQYFSDTYDVAAGRYRFVVRASNDGVGPFPGSRSSAAQARMSIPSPGAASLLTLGLITSTRRRRSR